MLEKLLGVLDLICIIALFYSSSISFVVFCAFYLLIKGMIFLISKDVISAFDVLIGGYLILTLIGVSSFIVSIVAGFFLLQKGILSLIR